MSEKTISNAVSHAMHQLIWSYSKWLLVILLIAYLVSGTYKIEKDSVGVVTRFGNVIAPSVSPGLHYTLPWPIDRVESVVVKQVKTLRIQDFGSRYNLAENGKSYQFYTDTGLYPYSITGDNNLVAITLVLKYTIDHPVKYLYGVKQPEYLVERIAANAIIHHIAKLEIDDVLTIGKKQLEFDVQKTIAQDLDQYQTGILISFLEIKEIQPPKRVQDAFNRVINAEVEKKKMLDEAQGYANRIVPAARSDAEKTLQEAIGYKREKILVAEGETSRFLARLEGFNQNPKAHRQKLYLEFIAKVYPTFGQVRVTGGGAKAGTSGIPIGFLPLLKSSN